MVQGAEGRVGTGGKESDGEDNGGMDTQWRMEGRTVTVFFDMAAEVGTQEDEICEEIGVFGEKSGSRADKGRSSGSESAVVGGVSRMACGGCLVVGCIWVAIRRLDLFLECCVLVQSILNQTKR